MEPDPITPGRGSLESAAWFKEQLQDLGLGQSALAKLMIEHGDDRKFETVLRWINRMASGEARVSGEMRVTLDLLKKSPQALMHREAEDAHAP